MASSTTLCLPMTYRWKTPRISSGCLADMSGYTSHTDTFSQYGVSLDSSTVTHSPVSLFGNHLFDFTVLASGPFRTPVPYRLPSKIVCRMIQRYFRAFNWSCISCSMLRLRLSASSLINLRISSSVGASPVCSWYCNMIDSMISGSNSGIGDGLIDQFLSPLAGKSKSVSLADTVLVFVRVRLKKALDRFG